MKKLVECVPNFSEGRDKDVIDSIVKSMQSVENVKVLDVDSGKDTIRTVVTIVGLIPIMMEAIGGLSNWIARNTGKNKAEIAQLKIFNAKIEEKEKLIKK